MRMYSINLTRLISPVQIPTRFLTKSQKSLNVDLRGVIGRCSDIPGRKYTCAEVRHPLGPRSEGPRLGVLRDPSDTFCEGGKSSRNGPEITAIGCHFWPSGQKCTLLRMGGTDISEGSPRDPSEPTLGVPWTPRQLDIMRQMYHPAPDTSERCR